MNRDDWSKSMIDRANAAHQALDLMLGTIAECDRMRIQVVTEDQLLSAQLAALVSPIPIADDPDPDYYIHEITRLKGTQTTTVEIPNADTIASEGAKAGAELIEAHIHILRLQRAAALATADAEASATKES